MDEVVIAGKAAIVLEMEPGTYWWCVCGRSETQPFCDGSHAGTCFEPKELVITQAKRCALCTCKMTKNGPMCDGSHKSLG